MYMRSQVYYDKTDHTMKPKDKTRRRMNLALHGGSAARVLGGALLGYGLTKVYNNRKKRKDERRRHKGSKA